MNSYLEHGGVGFLSARFAGPGFAPHVHDEYSIGVIVDGALAFECARAHYVAGPRAISAINPGETHTGSPGREGGWDYRNMFVTPDVLNRIFQETGNRPCDIAEPVIEDFEVADALLAAHRVVEDPRSSSLQRDCALASCLGLLFARHAENVPLESRLSARPSNKRCVDFIEAHYGDDIRLAHLADMAGQSPFHFLRTFAHDTHLTPHAYQVQVRLRQAVRRLRAGEDITEAAVESGFYDQSHLSRTLKRCWGITPASLRRAATAS
jgi:AraC-like DNA-binding protein